MPFLLSAVILGIVEGLTEFLPVSSTGHLILTGHLLGYTGAKAATFQVVIQLGAIMAVVVIYRQRFWDLLHPAPKGEKRFAGWRGIRFLIITSFPASIVGLVAHDSIKEHLFGPQTVAWALAIGAVAILIVEAYPRSKKYHSLDDMTPLLALGVGLFQCLALWPGFSRSAATIMGGMIMGADRKLAAEYSFIAAVPIMMAATTLDFAQNYALFNGDDLIHLAVGFVVSFIAAWIAVKGFIQLLQRITLRPFALYRLLIAPLVLLFWPE